MFHGVRGTLRVDSDLAQIIRDTRHPAYLVEFDVYIELPRAMLRVKYGDLAWHDGAWMHWTDVPE